MKRYQPVLRITPALLKQIQQIEVLVSRWHHSAARVLTPQLRRNNRIRTIQASLAIEHNTLTVEQVTAVLNGKRVLGQPREILEVRNAFAAYEKLKQWKPHSRKQFLEAHRLLMKGLIDTPGILRRKGVGIYRGKTLVHMAPPANRISVLLDDLLAWTKTSEWHPLLQSCVFHYELEFIHPFEDGNGRMGRLWQTLMLSQWQPLLACLPVETVIRDRQKAYYNALALSDKAGNAAPFVRFMLKALHDALEEAVASAPGSEKSSEKILAMLRQHPQLSARELAIQLHISSRAVEKQIAQLQKQKRLRRIGPAKGGQWKVKE